MVTPNGRSRKKIFRGEKYGLWPAGGGIRLHSGALPSRMVAAEKKNRRRRSGGATQFS